MTKSQISFLGSLLASGALVFAGCGGGGGSSTGTGGATGGGGKGTGGTTVGTGGHADAGTETGTDTGTDVHTDTAPTDTGPTDTGPTDTGPTDTGPCTTSFGSGSRLLFSFDDGSNAGWAADVSAVSYVFGSTKTDGYPCPGAISLTVNFTAFGNPTDSVQYSYGTPGDWTGYSKLHMWVKLVTSTYAAVNGVQPFVQSNNFGSFINGGFTGASTFSNGGWHEVVFDMTNPGYMSAPIVYNAINRFGIQLLVQGSATDGGPAAPTDVQMLVDSIWLEPAPAPVDAAVEVGTDVAPDSPSDVPPG